jgi:hypothetical protein
MDVEVTEFSSTVRAVDGALSDAETEKIIARVLVRVRDEGAHDRRVRAEQRVNAGRDESDYPG